jgi:hypothetical protein
MPNFEVEIGYRATTFPRETSASSWSATLTMISDPKLEACERTGAAAIISTNAAIQQRLTIRDMPQLHPCATADSIRGM